MASDSKNKLGKFLSGPALVIVGIMALWENEGRFNYYEAARDTVVINSPSEATADTTISMTASLDTNIPIAGEYVTQFKGLHVVRRNAQINSWHKSTDDEGRVKWSKGWHSSVQNNSRNQGLKQTLSEGSLYPPKYQLGDLLIRPRQIHFVDDSVPISTGALQLSDTGIQHGLIPQGNHLYKRKGRADELGDERIAYSGIPNAPTASYFGLIKNKAGVGKQFEIETSFVSALIQNDGILHHLVNGQREAALEKIKSHFKKLKWMVRGGGTLAVIIGLYTFFSSFMSLLYRIPLLGQLVSGGVFIVSLVLGLTISLLVILSSIFIHFPFLVALPTVLVIGAAIYMYRSAKTAKANAKKTLQAHQPEQVTNLAPGSSQLELAETNFVNLATLALAEGGLDKKENKYLINWGSKSGISRERMKELFTQAKQTQGELKATTREDLIVLTCLAMADGVISRKELFHLVAFGNQIGLDAKEVQQIIVDIESGNLAAA